MPAARLSPALFRFLSELKENNDRDWFAANKERFLNDLRDPALNFVTEFGPHLMRISPHFRADPRPHGGSLFRIYRDTRFSKDKSPYKTAAGLHFSHEAGKSAHTPGFYLHLEPRASFVGVGIWRPDGPTLKLIRERVAAEPEAWRRAVGGREFTETFQVTGESLKRPPRGFDPDHPLVDVLRLKDFTAFAPLTQKQVTAPDFIERFAGLCRTGAPLVRFVCEAVEQPF